MTVNRYKLEKYLNKYKQTSEMKYLDKVMYYLKGGNCAPQRPDCETIGFGEEQCMNQNEIDAWDTKCAEYVGKIYQILKPLIQEKIKPGIYAVCMNKENMLYLAPNIEPLQSTGIDGKTKRFDKNLINKDYVCYRGFEKTVDKIDIMAFEQYLESDNKYILEIIPSSSTFTGFRN